jgi:EAL domain-containing protein (putative c-di-GMP-specific phosphodiesterase class I)
VTGLAHVLGMTVTAEGVEADDQRRDVLAIGCEQSQGFWFGRPMTGPQLDAQARSGTRGPLRLPCRSDE